MSSVSTTQLIEIGTNICLCVEKSYPAQTQPEGYPTIVFLHFWGGSSRTWLPVNSLIAASAPTVRIDFPGWGSSTGPANEAEYSILKLAQDVEHVIMRLGLEKYIIVGHSMGAKVTQAIAGRKSVGGLLGIILLCPAPPTPLMLPQEMREQQISAYDNAQNAEFVARNVLTWGNLPDDMVRTVVEDMLKGNATAKAAWPHHAMNEDILVLAKSISVPALVVAGDRDQVEPVPRVKAEVCDNIPGAKLIVLREVGHMALLEATQEVAELVDNFISERI